MSSAFLSQLLQNDPVVITGMGCVSAAGCSTSDLWSNLLGGAVPCEWLDGDTTRPVYPIWKPVDSKSVYRASHRMDRSVQLALVAADQATACAGLSDDRRRLSKMGIVAGTSRGPVGRWTEAWKAGVEARPRPSLAVDTPVSSLSGALSLAFQSGGQAMTVSATCASGAYAISTGAEQLLLGRADCMLVGGSDSALLPGVLDQMKAAGMLGSASDATGVCRPFDRKRTGMALGEAAAFLVIERRSTAASRGAPILGVLRGWATSTDPNGRTIHRMDGTRLVDNMTGALELAGLTREAVDLVNAHGTGTVMNDRMELEALETFATGRRTRLPAISTKANTGHCLGATAALEAIISVLALEHQVAPPTANLTDPEPTSRITLVGGRARPAPIQTVLSNSLGFWGTQATLVFGRG